MHRFVNGQILVLGFYLLSGATLIACGVSSTPSSSPFPTEGSASSGVPYQQPPSRPPETSSLEPGSPESLSASQWSAYRNEEFNYTIDVAPNWKVDDSAKDEVILFIDRSDGVAGLHVLALAWSGTREAFTQRNYEFHRRRARVMFEAGTPSQVRLESGLLAERSEFRVQNGTSFCTEQLVDILVLAGGRGYVLQGSVCEEAESEYGETIEAMQRSFTLESGRVTVLDR